MKSQIAILAVTLALVLSMSASTKAAGVTIFTHGLDFSLPCAAPEGTTWLEYMIVETYNNYPANHGEIASLSGYIEIFDSNCVLYPGELYANIYIWHTEDQDSRNNDILITLDWETASRFGLASCALVNPTNDIAPLVVDFILESQQGDRPLAELPIHLVGHSRGGSLVCEIARLLGENGLWVDQITTLDPHPMECWVNKTSGEMSFEKTDESIMSYIDPIPMIYENVLFADNYWQEHWDPSDPDGMALAGAYNRYLEHDSIIVGGSEGKEHYNVHLWYHGTIDTTSSSTVWDGEFSLTPDVRTTWFTDNEDDGKGTGFRFSRLAEQSRGSIRHTDTVPTPASGAVRSGYSEYLGGAGSRTDLPDKSGAEWPNLLEAEVFYDGVPLDAGNHFVDRSASLAVKLKYSCYHSTSQITVFIDDDMNSFNGNGENIGNTSVSSTTRADSITVPVTVTTEGAHFICAKITDYVYGHTRYLYAKPNMYFYEDGDEPILPPDNVVASKSTSRYRITITWDSPGNADEYLVYRNTVDNSSTALLLDVITAYWEPHYYDTTAVEGQIYYYWIKSRRFDPYGESIFSESDWGMAGEPVPEVPHSIDIIPVSISFCGDSVVYTLQPRLYETEYRCIRPGEQIVWELQGCAGAWLELNGVTHGQYLEVISGDNVCESEFPQLKYLGPGICDVSVNLRVVGLNMWHTERTLHLDPECPDTVNAIATILADPQTSYGKIEYDTAGNTLIWERGYNTVVTETRNWTEVCSHNENSHSRAISPSGDSAFTVRSDYQHYLIDTKDCQTLNDCSSLETDVIDWSDNSRRIAFNTEGENTHIRIIDPVTCGLIHTCVTAVDDDIRDLDWRNNKLAALGEQRQITVWNTLNDSYNELWSYSEIGCHPSNLSCKFNSDASLLAVIWEQEDYSPCTTDNLVIRDAATGAVINSTVYGGDMADNLTDICWSPDDSKILVVGKQTFVASVFDASSLEPILHLNSTGPGSWCDWSNKDVIAIRDSEGLQVFTPFDVEGPTVSLSILGGEVYDTTYGISILVEDAYSVNLDSVSVNINDGGWLNIQDSSLESECDTAAWSFVIRPTNLQPGWNSIETRAMDRAGNIGTAFMVFTVVADADSDGIPDASDNCPAVYNPDQLNSDTDSYGDACDNCPTQDNNDQANDDTDSLGTACDNCPSIANDDQLNSDADSLGDVCDNCPGIANEDQSDADTDGIGDSCDVCEGYDDLADADSDTVPDSCDNCPSVANTDQTDFDGDTIGDACDTCTDSDGDGFGDPGYTANTCPEDNCPQDPENDSDEDGLCAGEDNCPDHFNPSQNDWNEDGIGDECDVIRGALLLDHVDGSNGAGLISSSRPIVFHLRAQDHTPENIHGMTNGLRVYSPDGAEWTSTIGQWTDAVTETHFDLIMSVGSFGVTGTDSDTIGFAGAIMYGAGLPPGFDDVAFTVEIGPVEGIYEGKQICIDSCFFPPGNTWKWIMGAQRDTELFPVWGGPYCFTVQGCCNLRADVDGNSTGPDIADLVYLVSYMFQLGPAPACDEPYSPECPEHYFAEADVNGDGICVPDIADLIYLVTYMFQEGPPPVPCPVGSPPAAAARHR